MPTYSYICENCRNKKEIKVSYADYGVEPQDCNTCSTGRMRKVITIPAIHYRGTGFYSTDGAKQINSSDVQ